MITCKKANRHFIIGLIFGLTSGVAVAQTGAIRINQLGYYPESNKIAVIANAPGSEFEVIDAETQSVELSGVLSSPVFWRDAGDTIKKADFSSLTKPGRYKIRIPGFGDSYPFEISNTVLRKAAYASLKSYYYQRCSYELTAPYAGVWVRPAGHPDLSCVLHSSTGKSGTISSPGGWYDAGDYGKYVINAGISVGSMLSFHELFSGYFADGSIKIPESGNGESDLLDEVKFELDWLKTMQDADGGVFFKLTTLNFCGSIMPDKDLLTRYVIGKTTASALDFAAMMAMAGRIYKDYDSLYAADCTERAEKAWIWAKANPAIYFKNPSDVTTGEYGDGNVTDEFLWAAAELYITTKKDEYKTYLETRSNSLKYLNAPGWPQVQPLASLSLATQENGLSEAALNTIKNSILTTADGWLTQISNNPARIPNFSYNWGSNSGLANIGVGLLYAYILSDDPKYIKGAAECADYLLGKNATGYSFVSGYGSKTPMNFHHRPSYADGIVQPVPGFVSGGPNSGKQDNEKYPFNEAAKCFTDVYGSYASNEVCINWNSPMTVLFAGVDAIMGDGSEVLFEVPAEVNNPPVISLTSPAYDAKLGSDVALKVKGTATDTDGISIIELYVNSRLHASTANGSFEWVLDLPYGTHTVSVHAIDTKGLAAEKTHKFSTFMVSDVPGKVEAESYYNMNGISVVACTDEDGGMNVSGFSSGDYLDFSLNVAKAGDYRVDYRVSGASSIGKLELKKMTGVLLSSLSVPVTGGTQKWVTISDTISLGAGKQVLKLSSVAGIWSINWINFQFIHPVSDGSFLTGSAENLVSAYPNPVERFFTVKYRLVESGEFDFVIYDSKGSLVQMQRQSTSGMSDGEFHWSFDKYLSSGEYYLVVLKAKQKIASFRLIKA